MKREVFAGPGIRIETWFDGVRNYVCWKPHVSVFCANRSEVLRFMKWPAKTPSGDALRDWLTEIEAADAKRSRPAPKDEGLTPELLATGFGPEAHQDEDPTANTRTII